MKSLPKEVPTQPLPKGVTPKVRKNYDGYIMRGVIIFLLLCFILSLFYK